MKVMLVGLGAVGSVLLKHLVDDRGVDEIVCATKNPSRSKGFVAGRSGKVRLIEADASKVEDLVRAGDGARLTFNVSLPIFNLNVMEAAIALRSDYQDLASQLADLRHPEQLRMHARFRKAGLRALIDTGVAPGITNMLAREGADRLDSVHDIRVRCVEEQKASEFVFAWSAETTMDDLTAPPLVYRDGKFVCTKPFEDMEEYDFDSPFGRRHAFSLYGDEIATIPLYIKTRNADFKSSGADIEFSKALSRLGLFAKKPVMVDGKSVVPIELFKLLAPKVPSLSEMKDMVKRGVIEDARFASSVEVIGKRAGRKASIRLDTTYPGLKAIMKRHPGATYISFPTGTAAYAFSKSIATMERPGVYPPETLTSEARSKVMRILKRNGITTSISEIEARDAKRT